MPITLISWLDAEPWRFWLVALTMTAIWVGTLIIPKRRRQNQCGKSPTQVEWKLWAIASIGLLLAWRWPFMVGPAILNPDEAQMIAGAITLKSHPIFWKYVDGTTLGPLADIPLLFGHAIGLPLNYTGARFMAGILVLGGFLLAGRGLMLIYAPRAIRVGLAPAMLLWASISFYDFSGYTGEQPAIFLMLASVWPLLAGLSRLELPVVQRASRFALGGFLLGCIPYAKLQGAPMGVAIGLSAAISILAMRSQQRRLRAAFITALFGSALFPTLIVMVYLWVWGLFGQFCVSYIQTNLFYAQSTSHSWIWMLAHLWPYMNLAPGLQTFVSSIVILGVVMLVSQTWPKSEAGHWPWIPNSSRLWLFRWLRPKWSKLSRPSRRLMLAFACFAFASLYTTITPGRLFGHYLQFLAVPFGLAGALGCGEVWLVMVNHPPKWRRLVTGLLVLGFILPPVIVRSQKADPEMLGLWTRNHGEWRFPASIAISQFARSGDTMSVWGWMPYFYVETGLPQATREAHTYYQIEPTPWRDFYRQRYLRDFLRSSPRIFVDAVGGDNFAYKDRQRDVAHESFPLLDAIIKRDYLFAKEVNGSRIYIRK